MIWVVVIGGWWLVEVEVEVNFLLISSVLENGY